MTEGQYENQHCKHLRDLCRRLHIEIPQVLNEAITATGRELERLLHEQARENTRFNREAQMRKELLDVIATTQGYGSSGSLQDIHAVADKQVDEDSEVLSALGAQRA
jgi:hypothetical protein